VSALPAMASGDGAAHRRHELHAGDALLAMHEGHVSRRAARVTESASDAETDESGVNVKRCFQLPAIPLAWRWFRPRRANHVYVRLNLRDARQLYIPFFSKFIDECIKTPLEARDFRTHHGGVVDSVRHWRETGILFHRLPAPSIRSTNSRARHA
jgi:hypothetical protein